MGTNVISGSSAAPPRPGPSSTIPRPRSSAGTDDSCGDGGCASIGRMPAPETFTAIVTTDDRGRAVVPVPFDPNGAWGKKARHHITGTVAGHRVRGPLDEVEDGY